MPEKWREIGRNVRGILPNCGNNQTCFRAISSVLETEKARREMRNAHPNSIVLGRAERDRDILLASEPLSRYLMHFGSRMENKSRECVFTRKKRRHGKKQSKSTYYLFPLSYPRLNGENKPRCANSEIPPALIVADPLSRSDSVPNFVPSRFPGSIIAFVGSPLFSIPLYVLSVRLKQ